MELVQSQQALIVIDVQGDYLNPNHPMFVPGSHAIVTPINSLINSFQWEIVVFTQDWHDDAESSVGPTL